MRQDKISEVLSDFAGIKQELLGSFESLKQFAATELTIDEFDLDSESLKTPKLHTRWLDLLSQASVESKKIETLYKKLYLERWKYYSGTATDKYYSEYGQIHVKVQKSDLDLYLNADDILCEAKELVEISSQKVSFCEKTVKEISSRTFHIRAAIDWRKFASGS